MVVVLAGCLPRDEGQSCSLPAASFTSRAKNQGTDHGLTSRSLVDLFTLVPIVSPAWSFL